MTREEPQFRAEMSASPGLAEPVKGLVARFDMLDGRHLDVLVPNAIRGVVTPCETGGFRVIVRRPDGVGVAELSAVDLVEVFGARSAAQALAAYTAGDLPRARRLAHRAGASWRGLKLLLREVVRRRAQGRADRRRMRA